jgi:hypothetical protein
VKKGTRAVSYAASFGLESWAYSRDNSITIEIKKALSNFQFVSVRESSGVKICKEIFNVKAEHVLDPTLLVGREFFDAIIDKDKLKQTTSDIVFYKLGVNEHFLKQIGFLSKELDYSVENIYFKSLKGKNHFNSVSSWLYKLRESKLIITDSFHCVCFAILFEKQFIYYPNENRGMARLQSLLGVLGLGNRICLDIHNLTGSNLLNDQIDYRLVKDKLTELRLSSMNFLKQALSEE